MSSPQTGVLTHADGEQIDFRPNGGDYRWVDVQSFRFAGEPRDADLLAAVVAHPSYAYSYAEPRGGTTPGTPGLHGPYRLEALSADSFVPTDKEVAIEHIRCWAGKHGPLVDEVDAAVETMIARHLTRATSVHRLPDLRAIAEHEWGGFVGVDGFEEFVAIDRARCGLSLVVCGDD